MSDKIIHFIDADHYHTVYGISLLIIVLMLLWFFIKTNISYTEDKRCSGCGRKLINGKCKRCEKSRCKLCGISPKELCNCNDENVTKTEKNNKKLSEIETIVKNENKMYDSSKNNAGSIPLEESAVLEKFPEFNNLNELLVGEKNRGLYGDVPVSIYDNTDDSAEWNDKIIYIKNSRYREN